VSIFSRARDLSRSSLQSAKREQKKLLNMQSQKCAVETRGYMSPIAQVFALCARHFGCEVEVKQSAIVHLVHAHIALYRLRPLRLSPPSVRSHVGRRCLPVPHRNGSSPVVAIVGLDVTLSAARHGDVQPDQVCPANGDCGEHVLEAPTCTRLSATVPHAPRMM
jgi:hypothetical protein